ncbi:MAG: lipocalin family protein [Cyclobacteriaceae bacterium]|nr:lipocalin family protein [Cytophagales bacterium]MBX2898680.1 lipocalin family protein [Cyclobacteriaceae bacterium]
MKLNAAVTLLACWALVFISSCKKDEDPEPAYEVQSRLLAGAKGSSKTWKLSSASVTYGSNTEDFEFSACFLDNRYKFTNNASQDYEASEGATKCNSTDPTIVESGHWSFTQDGGILIVLAYDYTNSDGVLFAYFTRPATVVELTDTSLRIDIEVEYEGDLETYHINFEAI